MEDKWLNDLHEGLSDFETEVPEGLWESLQLEELVEGSLISKPSKTRHPGSWRRRLAVAASVAAVLGLGTGIVMTIKETDSLAPTEILIAGRENDKDNTPIHKQTETKRLAAHTPPIAQPINPESTLPSSKTNRNQEAINQLDSIADSPIEPVDTTTNTSDTMNEDSMEEDTGKNYVHIFKEDGPNSPTTYSSICHSVNRRPSKGDDKYFLSITTSGIRSSSIDANRKIANPNFGLVVPSNPGNNGNNSNDANNSSGTDGNPNDQDTDSYGPGSEEPYPENPDPDEPNTTVPGPTPPVPNVDEYLDEHTDIHYYQPVRVALTVQYNLNNRFGIETGITYSRLLSKETVWSKPANSVTEQTLHYVGIPLNVKFSTWSWKCLNFYVSAGATLEKCVYNALLTTSHKDMETKKGKTLNGEKPFQWSVNAAAGVQIKLGYTVSIFAEPGISYYFNDGSTLKTMYKDKPFNFNLNMGLRFTFGDH